MAPRIFSLGTAGSELFSFITPLLYPLHPLNRVARDSLFCITTRHGLDGPVIESRWWLTFPRFFQTDLRA